MTSSQGKFNTMTNFSQSNGLKTNSQMPNISKTNVTLWKSKYAQNIPNENEKQVEVDYIENLRKQIYFMEMELKLMQEREKEIEKTGGFSNILIQLNYLMMKEIHQLT